MLVMAGGSVYARPVEPSLRLLPLDSTMTATASPVAALDIGTVSAQSHPAGAVRIVRQVAVLLEPGDSTATSARLFVALDSESSGCSVRVDGVPLTTSPRLVSAAHRLGVPVAHRIEIVIPPSAPPGAFLSTLQWSADSY